MEIAVWKYTVKSTVHGTWNQYGKHNISLLMPKYTDLHEGTRPDSHVTALWTFHIVKIDIYLLLYRFTNINFLLLYIEHKKYWTSFSNIWPTGGFPLGWSSLNVYLWRLKISLYVCVHTKTMPLKFRILNPKNSRVICSWNL